MRHIALSLALLLAALPASAQDEDPKVPAAVRDFEAALVKVVKQVSPCFVVIGGGSGVVISEDGYMLTNHHVAGDRAIGDDWRIKLPSGKIYKATMIGTDPVGDISLLKIHGDEGEVFPHVPFGDSDKCAVGDWVIALGNPFGFAKDSSPTVTVGLISAINRYRGSYGDAIQTDTPINSGNSGGPMLDIEGRLVGINGSIATRHGVKINSGAGFAISINQIKRFLPTLMAGGVVAHGRITGLQVTDTRRGGEGALVSSVRSGTPAADAGFKDGDVITAVQGLPVGTASRFFGACSTFPAGTTLEVVVLRDGEALTLKAPLSEFERTRTGAAGGRNARDSFGANFSDDDERGIVIESVTPNSPAEKAGLQINDVILAVDGETVSRARELRQLLRRKEAGAKLRLRIERNDEALDVEVTLAP